METGREILHCDLNSFYASVEIMLNPSLRGKAVAVCGSTEDRHGIVLAKSESAKKAGIKTGMVNWEAKRLCPGLVVLPPQYDQYAKYSRLAREIYEHFTDRVEPYGMDECWLDVTGSGKNAREIAEHIRKIMPAELGLTVSIGVSFNKVFAKLGSDMKKPDAVTVIGRDDYQEKIWKLPAGDLLYVGRATTKKLASYGILTIGDIAATEPAFLRRILGINGLYLWRFARGEDSARVMPCGYQPTVKSIGHGITCTSNLQTPYDVFRVILELSQDVGHRLRVHELAARGVQLSVKDENLEVRLHQARLPLSTQNTAEIAQMAYDLFLQSYRWHAGVRALTVRAISLIGIGQPEQLNLFDDLQKRERTNRLEEAVEKIRARFGNRAVRQAVLLGDLKIPGQSLSEVILPGMMYR